MAGMVNCQNNNPDCRLPSCSYVLAETGGSSSFNAQTLTELQSSGTALLANRRRFTHWHSLDMVLPEVMWFAQR